MANMEGAGASFRDPAGQVHLLGGRVFRTVMPSAISDFEYVRSTGLIDTLIERGQLIAESIVDRDRLGEEGEKASIVLEHPPLPYISYPYEWSFSALKKAAILHLDIHLAALEHGVNLSDATAYNIQFTGARPIFIDSLSFRRYQEGEFWLGHRQFCEQFLNPLLLRSLTGVAHNGWYRGEMEGISAQMLTKILPFRQKFSFNVFIHVVMQARLQSRARSQVDAAQVVSERKLPLNSFKQMLAGLRKWIAKLEPAGKRTTTWELYANDNSYSAAEAKLKEQLISEFIQAVMPKIAWDMGCNTGEYSKIMLDAGAGMVIGFDFDQGALDLAFSRAASDNMNFLPLFLDVANPTPSQGWAQKERTGLIERANADGIIALALVHHLAIGRNVPLSWIVDWLVSLAPQGIVEFVPKNDPMVQELLRLRKDIFEGYSVEAFERVVEEKAVIVRAETISANGRRLIWFKRR